MITSSHLPQSEIGCKHRDSGEGGAGKKTKQNGATSMIGTWFGFKKLDVEQKTVICKMCGVTVTANKGNMSNLFSHLKSKHVLEYTESQRLHSAQTAANAGGNKNVSPTTQQQPSIAEAFSKSIPYDRKSK